VPLGNFDALHDWGSREDPGYGLWMTVASWVTNELDARPWAAPSVQMFPAEGEPAEMRSVVIPGTSVTVIYEHHHESGRVDLLWVGRE
jgi:hypothetical protein